MPWECVGEGDQSVCVCGGGGQILQETLSVQYSRALKNASPKNGQAAISRYFKNMPGWKFEL